MIKCSGTDIGVSMILVSFFSLSFSLLIIEDYFSLSDLPDVVIGLSGASIGGRYHSFQDLIDQCSPLHILADYCDNLEHLEEGGRLLQTFLILDLILIVFFVLELIALRLLLRKLVTQHLRNGSLNRRDLRLAKLVICGRYAFFAHPVMLCAGLVLWTVTSKLDELQGNVDVEVGIVIIVFHFLVGLIAVTAYGYYINTSKRRNVTLMLQNQLSKNEIKMGEVIGKSLSKIKVADESMEFSDICLEV